METKEKIESLTTHIVEECEKRGFTAEEFRLLSLYLNKKANEYIDTMKNTVKISSEHFEIG